MISLQNLHSAVVISFTWFLFQRHELDRFENYF